MVAPGTDIGTDPAQAWDVALGTLTGSGTAGPGLFDPGGHRHKPVIP